MLATLANSAVPGPLFLFGAFNTSLGWAWIAGAMVICVGIEGFAYRYFRTFSRPFRLSLEANVVSAILGVPATLLGVIFTGEIGDIFVVPTLLTILIEFLYLYWRAPGVSGHSLPGQHQTAVVIGSNILTNIVLFGALTLAVTLFPTAQAQRIACQRNRYAIEAAKRHWAQDHQDQRRIAAIHDLLPYLKTNHSPQCPIGGQYLNVDDPETPTTCTLHP